MPCANAGCLEVNSLRRIRDHDSVCPFKLVPCDLSCGREVARREMRSHCVGACPRRPVECPFLGLGCTEAVRRPRAARPCRRHGSLCPQPPRSRSGSAPADPCPSATRPCR